MVADLIYRITSFQFKSLILFCPNVTYIRIFVYIIDYCVITLFAVDGAKTMCERTHSIVTKDPPKKKMKRKKKE